MKYFIETHGCQMNESDSEIVKSLLEAQGYSATDQYQQADIIIVNSCSVRFKAEQRAVNKLFQYSSIKKINPHAKVGLIGCTAQQKKETIQANIPNIDFVLGPDAYHDITKIIAGKSNHQLHVSCDFSETEMYDTIVPKYLNPYSGYIPITRGCNNFCTYCIVPFTRGRERSMAFAKVLEQARHIVNSGRQEIILLGQNVNSYNDKGKKFHDILQEIAGLDSVKRIRFTSPHPKDFTEETIQVMAAHDNICNHIHLPLQAGATRTLKNMNRTYSKEDYLELVSKIRKYIPEIALTTDIIVGFPDEREEDFRDTLDVMDKVVYDSAFMFKYSPRQGTKAAKTADNVPGEIKADRLNRIIAKQKEHTLIQNKKYLGKKVEVFVESESKKHSREKLGRTETNKTVIIKEGDPAIGSYVPVTIIDFAGVSLFGKFKESEVL